MAINNMRYASIIALLICVVTCATAQMRVVGISDGDTLTVFDENARAQTKIRISAIDAPEKSQPFGQQSKQALSDLCYGKPANIVYVDTDRYGRTVADVSCAGVDVGRSMVGSGMAWAYDRYIAGHEYLYSLQDKARHNKAGLWSIEAIPPWEWRKAQKNN